MHRDKTDAWHNAFTSGCAFHRQLHTWLTRYVDAVAHDASACNHVDNCNTYFSINITPAQISDPTLRFVRCPSSPHLLLSWVHDVYGNQFSSFGITGSLLTPFLPLTLFSPIITWGVFCTPNYWLIHRTNIFLTRNLLIHCVGKFSRPCSTHPQVHWKHWQAKQSFCRSFIAGFVSVTPAWWR
jgi:hypothetical protein